MRVLIISDDCNPDWPSLPSFAYQYALAISKYAEVVVATQIRNYRNIEKAGMGKAKVVYLNTERIAAPLYKLAVYLRGGKEKGWNIQTALDYPSYLAFEWYAWRRFKRDLINKRFDVVHRITPLSTLLPSFIANRCPVPFLIGPINGYLPWHDNIKPVMEREMIRGERFISTLLKAYKIFPYYKSTYKHSAGILASFPHTINGLSEVLKFKAINFPEVGFDPKLFTMPTAPQKKRMTIIFVGRLVPLKMPEVLVQAFANSEILRQHKLLFVGDGPERANLEKLVSENNLNDCVEFKGQQLWSEVAELMRQSDIFAFPSIHELGGGVVVEAMACGLACVVVDFGGPGTLVADDRGIKIPLGTAENICKQFQYELEQLVTNPERVQCLGNSANKHVMIYYTWDAKARKTLEIYRWLTGIQKQKPYYWDTPILNKLFSDNPEQNFSQSSDADTKSIAAQYKMANTWLQLGKTKQAEKSYRKIIELKPDSKHAYLQLSRLLSERDRLTEAIEIMRQGVKANPNEAELHKEFINALERAEKLSDAFNYYKLFSVSKKIEIATDDILCCVVVRNELHRLPYFLSYYRSKGIKKFFVVDNDSTDETIPYLLEQPDVFVWQSTLSFNQANFGSVWFELLLRKFGKGHWCLTLDADELLVYPDCEQKNIPQLCKELDDAGKTVFTSVLLDMYSNKAIKDTHYTSGRDFLEVCHYFDQRFYHNKYENSGPFKNQTFYFGGVRQRVFGPTGSYLLSKAALLKYDSNFILGGGQHWTNRPENEIAEETGCLLHFKFFTSFIDYAKQETKRKEHYGNAMQYQEYAQGLLNNENLTLYDTLHSIKFRDSRQLIDLGIMKINTNSRMPSVNYITEMFPKIESVPSDTVRPFWSVIITVYKRTQYLERALKSVLEQAPSAEEMQIEIIQDGTDETIRNEIDAIIRNIGGNRICFYPSSKQYGHPYIFNLCIERVRGYWIHILHDDDWIKPGFYSSLKKGIETEPNIGAAFCRHIILKYTENEHWISELERETPGIIKNWLERIATKCRLQFSSIVVKREVYEKLGGFYAGANSAFDWDMWKRIALFYPFWFEPEILLCSSKDGQEETAKLLRSGQQVADTRKSIELSLTYLPKNVADELTRKAGATYARYALEVAKRQFEKKDYEAAIANIREGLKCDSSEDVKQILTSMLIKNKFENKNNLTDTNLEMQNQSGMNPIEAQFKLANAWQLQGRFDAAITGYQRVLNLNPNHIPAYTKLAAIMLKQGRTDQALLYYKKISEIEPDNKDALFKYNYLKELLKEKSNNHAVQKDTQVQRTFKIEDIQNGKINLQNQISFSCHRSGWNFVIHSLTSLHNKRGILFDGFIEHNFAWKHPNSEVRTPEVLEKMKSEGTFEELATSEEKGITPYTEPWVGFIHNPQNIPAWFHYQESPQTIFAKKIWRESLVNCLGLFTFSEYHAKWLREQTGKPVSALVHPTEFPEMNFDFQRFLKNPQKKIIQIGWWLRRLNAVYQLPIPKNNPLNYEKIRLVPLFFGNAHEYLKGLMEREHIIQNLEINHTYSENTREIIHVSNSEYDELLSQNIAFVNLYDANANNMVIECIARATPLLINPLPAVVEYLGEDYPMYFANLEEAAKKALDTSLIFDTHNYLKNTEIRTKLTGEYFVKSFEESEVYKLI